MSQYAPESPTTQELHDVFSLSDMNVWDIEQTRARLSSLYRQETPGFVATLGPCAMTDDNVTISSESARLAQITQDVDGLWLTHRLPVWKPRSCADDWHGLETTDPVGAYHTLADQAMNGAGVSIEIGRVEHAQRYGGLLVTGWFGGRSIHQIDMMRQVAVKHPDLPLLVKNGLDGRIDQALRHVDELTEVRGPEAAPVLLLYRGGENAQTPQAWENKYVEAWEMTKGRIKVDIAHGSEMAHHPEGRFQKSVAGQIACLDHVIRIAEEQNILPVGLMAEASSAHSPTDPHMPLDVALAGVLKLCQLRMNGSRAVATV